MNQYWEALPRPVELELRLVEDLPSFRRDQARIEPRVTKACVQINMPARLVGDTVELVHSLIRMGRGHRSATVTVVFPYPFQH
jgi:hypothetical protein